MRISDWSSDVCSSDLLRYTTHSNKVTERAMKTRAAVAFEAKKPLEIVEVDLEGPKTGEVLVEIMATGICHTDAYTLDGFDSDGIFPSLLGLDGPGIVHDAGLGLTRGKARTSVG